MIREAKVEFGEAVAKNLKLSSDGLTVLWPQPTDDPEDPQNVCSLPLRNDLFLNYGHSGRTSAKASNYL